VTEAGRATGPQRAPRRQRGAKPPQAADDQEQGGAAEAAPLTSAERRRVQYGALRARTAQQASELLERLAEMPEGVDLLADPTDDLLHSMMDIEKRATLLRLDLDQLGCAL